LTIADTKLPLSRILPWFYIFYRLRVRRHTSILFTVHWQGLQVQLSCTDLFGWFVVSIAVTVVTVTVGRGQLHW